MSRARYRNRARPSMSSPPGRDDHEDDDDLPCATIIWELCRTLMEQATKARVFGYALIPPRETSRARLRGFYRLVVGREIGSEAEAFPCGNFDFS